MNSKNRNQPCSCGSNKKFKKCCWSPNDLAARITKQREELRVKMEKEKQEFEERKKQAEELVKKNPICPRGMRGLGGLFMISALLSLDMRSYQFR